MNVHLIDGTYELFRQHFGAPRSRDQSGRPVGAIRGVLGSVLTLLESGATHIAVATDHVIESFRNKLWPGYKTAEGIDPDLIAQFRPLEDSLREMGVTVWPMKELEADDALASGAARAARDPRVGTVFICTPDKDLAQCVAGDRVVQWDRRQNIVRNEAAVVAKFGVLPNSIPDYLALVGDSADGFPGLAGWGAKSAATVLRHYRKLEQIPARASRWEVTVRGASRLAATLRADQERACLFRMIATLRDDAGVLDRVDEVEWRGARPSFQGTAAELRRPRLWRRVEALRSQRFE